MNESLARVYASVRKIAETRAPSRERGNKKGVYGTTREGGRWEGDERGEGKDARGRIRRRTRGEEYGGGREGGSAVRKVRDMRARAVKVRAGRLISAFLAPKIFARATSRRDIAQRLTGIPARRAAASVSVT